MTVRWWQQQSGHPVSLLLQVTGKAGIVVRGQRTVQVGKLNSKSLVAGQQEAAGFLGQTVRVARVSPKFPETTGSEQSVKRTERGW